MKIINRHEWELTPKASVALQRELKVEIRLTPLSGEVKTVTGADVSYNRRSDLFFAGVVLLALPGLEVIETASVSGRVTFPYVPGLLSFREGPILLEAFKKLQQQPNLVIFDGQGVAHPRGIGIAAHLGLFLGVPTVGCAKTRLCGEFDPPGEKRGAESSLTMKGEAVGAVVRTKDRVKPLFVSPGHLIDIKGSVEAVLNCFGGYRLPEPTRQAHLLVNRLRMEGEVL